MIGPLSYWDRFSPKERSILESYTKEIPVRVGKLANELGVPAKVASLKPGISGELRRSSSTASGFLIRVNRHEVKYRQRFTIAHEISHYLLHRDHIGSNGLVEDLLYRSSLSDAREIQANRLAADILMPAFQVKRAIENTLTSDRDRLVIELASIFDVSEAAMRIRLQGVKL